EDRHEVPVRIADVAPLALEQDLVEEHDAERLVEAVTAQARREQPIREPALASRQLAIREPLPVDRREVPVEALLVFERERRLVALRVVERRKEMPRVLPPLARGVPQPRAAR